MRAEDEAPTVVTQLPFGARAEIDTGAITTLRTVPSMAGGKGAEPPAPAAVSASPEAAMGGDDAFILAWGRSDEALRSRSRQLLLSTVFNVALLGLVGYLAWRNEQKETYVFVRDRLGNIAQAEPNGFLRAGDRRTEVEIKGFVRRWVTDAFTWTPLDVEDRLRAALRVVDGKAQATVKAGLRLGDRKGLVDAGTSGRVWEDARAGREPQVVIERTEPLEVLVAFERYLVDATGARADAGGLFARVVCKEVPRSPANPYGLVIVDARISERL